MGRLVRIARLVLVILILCAPRAGQCGEASTGPQPDPLPVIIKAWKGRQESIRSLDFRVAGTEFYPKKDMTKQDLVAEGQPFGKPFTLSEITFPITMRFALDERGRACFRYEGQTWSAAKKGYIPKSDTMVFDGSLRKVFFGKELDAKDPNGFPTATIGKGDIKKVAGATFWRPLLILFRPFDPKLSRFDSEKLRLADGKGLLDGQECFILQYPSEKQDVEHTFWVDPSQDFLPLRYRESRKGMVTYSIDLRYTRDGNNHWNLAGWTYTRCSGLENIHNSVTVTVSEAHLNNPIADDVFDLPPLPPGTLVHSGTDGDYIVRDDSRKRPVKDGDFKGTNFQQLLHSDPPGEDWRRWGTPLSIGLLLLLAIAVVVRRFRQRA